MQFLKEILPNFSEIFTIISTFFMMGGWVLFLIGLIYMLYRLYRVEIEHQFVNGNEWVFLSIKVPKENLTSTLAVESIFSQLHALHAGLTFAQIYMEGRIQLWYSFEIISMGGKVSFIIRVPKPAQALVESAFYTHYADAEISEISDYLENFHYDPENESDLEIWGTEWKLTSDDIFPIKTYKDFEHPSAEEKIIDPLSNLFEALSKFSPHEFYGVQIITQPLGDDEWKPRGETTVKELIGEEVPYKITFTGFLLKPLEWVANFSYREFFFSAHKAEEITRSNKNDWMSMTETQKERVSLIESKIGKPGYKTKIRNIYIAPKQHFDLTKRAAVIGAYRPLGSAMSNRLKPDVSKTWTNVDYMFSPTLEKPYIDWLLKQKKRRIFKGFKARSVHIGLPMFVMNTEELATMYHFPITNQAVSATVEKTLSKKAHPPVDLPISDIEP